MWYSSSLFSLIIAYSTLSLFHLEWWFSTCYCMEDDHILAWRTFSSWTMVQILFWGIVLLVRIHVTSICGESLLMWLYFYGRSFIIDQSMCKKEKRKKDRAHCSFYHSPLSTCIDVLICFIEFMCWRVHMRALRDFPFTRFYLDMYFWVRVWVVYLIFVRGANNPSLVSLDRWFIHYSIYF